jgi:NAD(P)-dependent dehydrogenase (short-subunit alcohol dehydrogenase family)
MARFVAVGAGRMGRSIATAFAYAGHRVAVVDLRPRTPSQWQALQQDALAEVRSSLNSLADLGAFPAAQVEAIVARVSWVNEADADAALAQAELEGRSGRDLVVALVAGYELVCRLADDFIPSTAARGFRPSPLYATLGAALSCAVLMGLDEDRLVTAIALATHFASGLNEGPRVGANELLIHEPQAARNGVFAAVMARAGHI